MKSLRFILMALIMSGYSRAADLITSYIVLTNNPTTNAQTITINGTTKSWTNSVTSSPGTLIPTTNTVANSATNLLNHLTIYRVSTAHYLSQTTPTNVTLRGAAGEALTVTLAGGWGFVTNSTQTVATPSYLVRVPLSISVASNEQTIASLLVKGLSDYSTNSFDTNSTSLANYVSKGAHAQQTVIAPTFLVQGGISNTLGIVGGGISNVTISGTVVALTNGYFTNTVLASPISTNGANYGNAFRSPGSYPNSDQFGSGAQVAGGNSIAVGPNAVSVTNGTAIGYLASAGTNGVAVGSGADSSGSIYSVAIGQNSAANAASNSMALGQSSVASHSFSTALGYGAQTTSNAQVMVGSSSLTVTVPGMLWVTGTQTNTTLTGTNVINGRVDFKSRANTSPANGNNSGVVLGTNVFVRISGPTTIGAYAGFAAEQDGSWHIVSFTGAITNTFYNSSGLEATAANRITTGTGGDLSLTNNPLVVLMVYDAATSRWIINSLLR